MYSDFYFRSRRDAQNCRRACHAAGGWSEGLHSSTDCCGWFIVRVPFAFAALFARVSDGFFSYRVDSFYC